MKKTLSIILALALCFTMATGAFAASDSEKSAAAVLYDYGIFLGKGTNPDGTPDFDLDAPINRVEALTLFVRMLGKENAAKAGTFKTPFVDVPDWATGYVGFAYTNGYTNGIDATHFGSEDAVSGAQFTTFVLRALGYVSGDGKTADFKWENAPEFAREVGAIQGAPYTQASLTRGKVAAICHSAIENAMMKSGETSLKANIEANLGHKLGNNNTTSSFSLVGVWEEIDIDNVYTFNADGTGSEYYDGETWQMTWKLVGNTLTMNFPKTGVEVYEITLTENYLIVHNPVIDFEYTRQVRTAASIVGIWEEIDIDNFYVFNADGTGSEYYDGETWQMTWKLVGNTLTMNFPETGVEVYEITLTENYLIVHNPVIDFEYTRHIRTATSLVGVWEEIDIDNIYTFRANGTGSEYYDGDLWNMTWKLVGNTLTITFSATDIEVYEITLSDNFLIVHAEGVDYEYVRI